MGKQIFQGNGRPPAERHGHQSTPKHEAKPNIKVKYEKPKPYVRQKDVTLFYVTRTPDNCELFMDLIQNEGVPWLDLNRGSHKVLVAVRDAVIDKYEGLRECMGTELGVEFLDTLIAKCTRTNGGGRRVPSPARAHAMKLFHATVDTNVRKNGHRDDNYLGYIKDNLPDLLENGAMVS